MTLRFIKHLIDYDKIDINYLNDLEEYKFIKSNLHKLVTSLCVNYINLNSEIIDKQLKIDLQIYRNYLVHCEGSINKDRIKSGILNILKDIMTLNNVKEFNEYEYMIY